MNKSKLCMPLVFGVGFALAADPPLVKEGYWSIHTVTTSNPGNKKTEGAQNICRNHAYDEYVRELAKKQLGTSCKVLMDNLSGGVYTSEQECTIGATKMNSKGVTTFQGDSATHSETHTTNTPEQYGVA